MINGIASEWTNVTNGVPQGSVLGPILFVLYINDFPDDVNADSNIYMFADDTKLYREMSDVTDVTTLQIDITEMDKWSNEWLMSFHPAKCKVLKLGRPISDLSDIFNPYTLSDHHLEVEKDIGVIIDCELSFDKHIAEKVNKATKIVNIIRRSFMYLAEEIFLNLYKALVRPHLEYANQIWSPRLQRQIDSIENVQKRATKLLPMYDNLSYEERLKKLRLPTLTYRRLRGDLIETYKILTNKYDPEICGNFIELRKDSNTRGHSLKIYKQRCKLNVRKNCFPHRIVEAWNCLPEQVIKSTTVQQFEGMLDRVLKEKEIYYDYRAKLKFKITGTGSQIPAAEYIDLILEA